MHARDLTRHGLFFFFALKFEIIIMMCFEIERMECTLNEAGIVYSQVEMLMSKLHVIVAGAGLLFADFGRALFSMRTRKSNLDICTHTHATEPLQRFRFSNIFSAFGRFMKSCRLVSCLLQFLVWVWRERIKPKWLTNNLVKQFWAGGRRKLSNSHYHKSRIWNWTLLWA